MTQAKSYYYANGLLQLVFQNTTFASVANASATGYTNLYVSLHTADPELSTGNGFQNTSETIYNSYARVPMVRTTVGWVLSAAGTISPNTLINFATAQSNVGSNTITFFGIGSDLSGSGNLFYSGPVSPNIAVANGVAPQLLTCSTIQET